VTLEKQQAYARKSHWWIWWLAWRQFSARRQRGGLSFMTVVSILGVAIGVGALVLVLSVMGGFEGDLREKMLMGEPHLEIISATNALAGISLKEHPLADFKQAFPDALAIEPFVSSDVVLKRRGYVTSATLIGVRPEMKGTKLWAFDGAFSEGLFEDLFTRQPSRGAQLAPSVPEPAKNLSRGAGPEKDSPQQPPAISDLPGIALGDQLALQIGADVGDEITVLSPQASSGAALGGGTIGRRYVITGKISTGLFSYDGKWSVVSLDEGRFFMPDYDPSLAADGYITGLAMNVRDPMELTKYTDAAKNWTGLAVRTWQMTNKSLLLALKLEKFTMGSILMLIVLVAAFSISGTMIMTVFHKRGQVSVLRALGMSQREIAKLFLAHGFTIGTVGVAFGLIGGIGLCFLIQYTHRFSLPEGMYYLKSLPVKFLPNEYMVICLCAWVFTLVASTYPALVASRQNPSDGVRYE
jgi:lipoprotein-releasing system permease protein